MSTILSLNHLGPRPLDSLATPQNVSFGTLLEWWRSRAFGVATVPLQKIGQRIQEPEARGIPAMFALYESQAGFLDQIANCRFHIHGMSSPVHDSFHSAVHRTVLDSETQVAATAALQQGGLPATMNDASAAEILHNNQIEHLPPTYLLANQLARREPRGPSTAIRLPVPR